MNNTLANIFINKASQSKKIIEIESGVEKTHYEVANRAKEISKSDDIKNGKIITVILPNSVGYIECFLGCMLKGSIFSPLPYFTQIQELDKVLTYVEPSLIITDRPDVRETFSEKYKVSDVQSLTAADNSFNDHAIDINKPIALYYSSGTTGNPKGVLYSSNNMLNLISSIVRGFKFSDQDKQLAFLPFGHTASINYNILPALLTGCDLYISKGFEFLRSIFFSILSDYQITYTEIVPTVLFVLNKLKIDVSSLNFSSLSFIGCGSSTLPLEAQKEFINQYNIGVGNLYGLSETGPTHIDDPREKKWQPGSIGIPLDVNECKVSKNGELLIKGDNVFIGYYKNQNLYEDVVVDGWFRTGDLGYMDNGRYYFSDRKKDLIIKGGINIVPMEIEEVIYKHSEILECVVVGREDSIHGEEVVAVCVKNGSITEENLSKEILEICRAELSSYKIPKQIYFWEELPKTASHKLLRKDVREKINKLSVR